MWNHTELPILIFPLMLTLELTLSIHNRIWVKIALTHNSVQRNKQNV